VSPGKLAKLVLIQAPFQCQNEPHKPYTQCKNIRHTNEDRGACHPKIIKATNKLTNVIAIFLSMFRKMQTQNHQDTQK
jgi:hypothetical protein